MVCQHCGRNEATFYYKSTVNGRTTQTHLCNVCARDLGYADALRPGKYDFFSDPFALLREGWFDGAASRLLTEFPAPGNTLTEAKETVRRQETDNLLDAEESRAYTLQRQRNALTYRLQEAIETENYEEAARLRDELRALPQE